MHNDIRDNIVKHERIADDYNARHPEIYNDIEQNRLRASLNYVRSLIRTDAPVALDYGCGTGNVSRHLLALGFRVIAADVTPAFVDKVVAEHRSLGNVEGRILNGKDLGDFPSDSLDAVTIYSVLHHIPDYLSSLGEAERVLKPGGILFIDHEFAPEYWSPSPSLLELRATTQVRVPLSRHLKSLVSPAWYVKRLKKTLNPRYQEEGDIHVWPDDHIEWEAIHHMLSSTMQLVRTTDYLYFQQHYPIQIFDVYKVLCADLREVIYRKY